MQHKKKIKISITKAMISALCFGMLLLACFCLKDIPRGVLLAIIIVFASLGIVIAGIDTEKHAVAYKVMITIALFCLVGLASYIILSVTGLLEKFKDLNALTNFIRGTKQWGILVYIGIVIFQVIVLPIPAMIVSVIGSALYGGTYAFIFMTVGTIVGSVITFYLGRIFGKKLVNWMVGEKNALKYAEVLNQKGKFAFILMMLFPFFPDDIICLVAGSTNMSFKYFITAITLTRPVMIAFYCYFGTGSIIPFKGWGIPVWISIFVVTCVLFFVVNKLKNKWTENHKKESDVQK